LNTERSKYLLDGLNKEQREAVRCIKGPVLVLAGAGSGKTRVLIHRIAYLLANGLTSPDAIMAVTFTNKAAGEMKERLERLGGIDVSGSWIGTFHSLGARILRREAAHLGMDGHFNIYDADDTLSCIKLVLAELNISTDVVQPKAAAYKISHAKNAFLTPPEFEQTAETRLDRLVAQVYHRYQAVLRKNNALDFDDLLMKPVLLFQKTPAVLSYYQEKFEHILVDEYQDTNRAQYLLLKLLAGRHRNLFVVGDDDQSIYRWRGADLRNILDFARDYPDCSTFRLEQNYRSSRNILDAAHSVVVHNQGRHEKKLWTERGPGEKVLLMEAFNEREEAELIVERIHQEMGRAKRSNRDFAILYRTNAQSRVLEDAMRRYSIAYVIVGGIRFYERKEIKDVLAYLRVVANPLDTVSLRRIINYPLRGIGEATLRKLQQFALEQHIPFFDALGRADEVQGLSARLKSTVKDFHQFIAKYISLKEKLSLTELATSLIEETGILQLFKSEATPDALSRRENVLELLNAISEYARNHARATLEGFLEEVSLIADIDTWDDRGNAVTLMTLHSAKGLEFPVVFICGLEEGLFPLTARIDSRDDMEEERRLFYVGATRAKELLCLSYATRRARFGESQTGYPSRFLKELDASLVERYSSQNHHRMGYAAAAHRRHKLQNFDETAQVMPDYENFTQEALALYPGMRVRHEKFGIGEVQAVDGAGESMKVVVNFRIKGKKTLMVRYANLQIL